jgi:uncharacterized membrane protein
MSQCHGIETSVLQTLIHIDMLLKLNGSIGKNIRSLIGKALQNRIFVG